MIIFKSFLILMHLFAILAASNGIRSMPESENINAKTRRCLSKATDNNLSRQLDSSESKGSEESDENHLNSDQILSVKKTEERNDVVDKDFTTMPEVVDSTTMIDDTGVKPMPEKAELTDGPDETCWNFEKERCNEIPQEWRIYCQSDSSCQDDGVNKEGECCTDACENNPRFHPLNQRFCRWPIDTYDLVESFKPVSARQKK
ncbi:uncharacterized protein LOC133176035 [Saccostrea echinata]|uniref:uncharacterized protein LOC133176035 n=1 Tax=Saccostrea echinata TaxID=191078 RepID=UPI002A82EEA7|nr:uncharacterized protein LOC133176035 [Saccostrea echinata]